MPGNRDQGCPGSLPHRYAREIFVTSATGLSPEQMAQIVTGAFDRLHGWRLSPYESNCRFEGWLLGWEDLCVEVQTGQNAVQVLLQSGP
jgi:hypothetical protein